MENVLNKKEIKQLNKLGEGIRISLDLNLTDLNNIGIPCRHNPYWADKFINYDKTEEDYGIKVTGLGGSEGAQDFIAPLPTIGLRMDFALTPKWYFRSGTQLLYLETDDFRGSLLATYGSIEYKPLKHVGIGLGVDSFRLSVEAEGEDYPSIDFRGNVDFEYVGIQLYTRIFF